MENKKFEKIGKGFFFTGDTGDEKDYSADFHIGSDGDTNERQLVIRLKTKDHAQAVNEARRLLWLIEKNGHLQSQIDQLEAEVDSLELALGEERGF